MVRLRPFECPFQNNLRFVLIVFQKEFIELSRALLAPSAPLEKGRGSSCFPCLPPLPASLDLAAVFVSSDKI